MRIRYRHTRQEGILESVQRYNHPTSGARYRVMLNMNEHLWLIVDDGSDLIAASGLHVMPHKMKIDARKALEKLGVVLDVESRNRNGKINSPVVETEQ